jgi:PAS domain S-box-containing protein
MYKLRDFVGILLKKLWGFLTAPLEKMRHAEDERRAKVVTAFFLFCIVAIKIDQMVAGNIPRLALWFLLGGYFLARTRWYKIATIILIVILTVPSYLIVAKSPNIEPYEVFAALVWVILPLLLVSLIFSVRTAILIYAANIAAVLAMPFLYSHLSFRDIGEALGFFILTSLVILIVMIEQIKLEDIRQAELRRSQERFYKIFHTSPDAISISELENGRIIEINNSFSSMLGFAPGECIGRTSIELNMYVNDADRFEMDRLLKEHSEINGYEFRLRHKNGAQFIASASFSPIELDGKACLIWMMRDVTMQRQFAERLEILHEIDRALLSASSSREITKKTLARIRQLIPSPRASVTLFDFSTQQAFFLAADLDEGGLIWDTPVTLQEYGEYVIDEIRQNKPFILNDVLTDPRANELDIRLAKKDGIHAWLYLPLLFQGQLIGALNLGRGSGEHFTAEDAATAQDVANQLAISVQQTRLYEALQKELTERIQTEEKLVNSEARLRALVENSPDFILEINRQGEILFINRYQAQFVGRNVRDILPPDQITAALEIIAKAFDTGQPQATELQTITPEGQSSWDSIRIGPVKQGELVTSLTVIMTDVTIQKQSEVALQRSESIYRRAIMSAGAVPYVLDHATHTLTFVGDGILDMTGYTAAEMMSIPRLWNTVVLQNIPTGNLAHLSYEEADRITEEDHSIPWECDFLIRTRDGRLRWIADTSVKSFDEKSEHIVSIGIKQDITERKQAEAALLKSASRLELLHNIDRALLSAQSPAEIARDALTRIRQLIPCQRISITLFDFEKNEAIFLVASYDDAFDPAGQSVITLQAYGQYIIDELLQDKACRVDDVLTDPRCNELDRTLAQDGFRSWLYLPLLSQGQLIGGLNFGRAAGHPFTIEEEAIAHEVANQLAIVLKQNQLYESLQTELTERMRAEARMRAVVENSPDFILEVNRQGEILFINRAPEIYIGRNILEFVPADASAPVLEVMEKAFTTGQPQAIELQTIGLTGETYWDSVRLGPVKDGNLITSLTLILTDIRIQKRAEAERESFIKELEAKNAELERFNYTVSHELKSPIVTIKGFLGSIAKDIHDGKYERAQKDLLRISTAADKMHDTLSGLLELSRIGRIANPPEEVNLVQLAHEALETAHGRIQARNVTVRIAPDLPTISGDRIRLREIYENLIDNAAKYMGDQPAPLIEIGVRNDEHEIVYFVKDNGIGIDKKYHKRIFGLFDKLDATSEGTGIGLALIKRIIETHGGKIWVESEGLGKGSTFCFTIPHKE